MKIEINNCNNIEKGSIMIYENHLNIKYAINGTGKSTISKAIELSVNGKNSPSSGINELKPFKYRKQEGYDPEINGLDNINNIAIFNEDYVNKYVFLQDELVKNSFNIFIRDDKYNEGMKQITDLINIIGETFDNNKEIDLLLNDLNELSDCFGKSKSGYSAAGSIGKGIGKGNKVENIPKGLEIYEEFIRHDSNVKWLKWHIAGNEFLEISEKCPYCTSDISEKKETIRSVSKEYDSKLIEHLNKVINLLQRLNTYFTNETNNNINEITKNVNGLTTEQINYLLDIKKQIDELRNKLYSIKKLNFHRMKDVDKVVEIIGKYKIELCYYSFLNTVSTSHKIDIINSSLDKILAKAGILQGEVNKQKRHIEDTIKTYKTDINNFLKYAGYNYQVDIVEEENEIYKMKLRHNEHSEIIDNVRLHLSFGERNAFALVLFMFEAVKNSPDLVILDDPISSFDKNKKFAIINMLFRGNQSLRNKTVLMLTHDFDPIIDMIYNLPHKFSPSPYASFLDNTDDILIEKEIKKSDIKTFLEITIENIELLDEAFNKMVYLRRLFEISNDKKSAHQLLSNLFHKREIPIYKSEGIKRNMSSAEIQEATEQIQKWIPGFDYKHYYDQVIDSKNIIQLYKKSCNNYEKLQLYRIINNENAENDVIQKFVNETFHIENDYLFQLNPCKYQVIPQYIIYECDKDISLLETNS